MDCVVTALYEVEPYFLDGDPYRPTLCRQMAFDYYVGGLYSLKGLNKDIILFCNDRPINFRGKDITPKEVIDQIIPDKDFTKQIKFVPISLPKFYTKYDKHWEQCTKIAQNNPDRLLCWNPPMACCRGDIFDYVFKNYNYDTAIWFDAALSNESYVSTKYGGTWHDWELNDWKNYYPDNKEAIFCPDFYNNIGKIVKEYGNVICGLNWMNLEPKDFIKQQLIKNNNPTFYNFSSTGAFLGFTKDYFYNNFYNDYNKALDTFIDNYDDIFTEIEVFSYMNMFKDFAKVMWTSFHSNIFDGSMQKAFLDIVDGNFKVRFNDSLGKENLNE